MRCLALLCLLAGCVTPSIPIPPPDPAEMTFHLSSMNPDATTVFTYPVNLNYKTGIVYLFNRNTGRGVFQNANPDGSLGPTQPLAAQLGHQMVVSVQVNEQTVSTCIVLQEGAQNPNNYCQ